MVKKGKFTFDESDGIFVITLEAWHYLYKETLDKITLFVDKLYDPIEMCECKDVIIVGGFSQSEFLKDALLTKLSEKDIKLHQPRRPHLSIVKGGALWYVKKHEITSYVMHMTYGFKCDEIVNLAKDPQAIMNAVNGEMGYVSSNKFDAIIYKNDKYSGDQKISREYTIQPGITKIIIDLFAIDDERGCKYVTDRGCKSVQIYKMTFKKPFVEKQKLKLM